MAKNLTEAQVEESVTFAQGALAAAGHTLDDPQYLDDLRESLKGNISREEMISRIRSQATSR